MFFIDFMNVTLKNVTSQFFVKSLINLNCHNSRTSYDIDMKFKQQPKLDNRNTMILKRFRDDFILVKYDVIFIFSIYNRFGAIRKPDSACIVLTFSLKTISSRSKVIFNTAFILLLAIFGLNPELLGNADISKTLRVLALQKRFFETTYAFAFMNQISSFKGGVGISFHIRSSPKLWLIIPKTDSATNLLLRIFRKELQ